MIDKNHLYSHRIILSSNPPSISRVNSGLKKRIQYLQPKYASYKKHQISKTIIKRNQSQNHVRICPFSPVLKSNQIEFKKTMYKQPNQMYQTPIKLISNHLDQNKTIQYNNQTNLKYNKKQQLVKPLLIQQFIKPLVILNKSQYVQIQQNNLNFNQLPSLTKQIYKQDAKYFESCYRHESKHLNNNQERIETVQNIDLDFQMKVLRLNQNLSKLMGSNQLIDDKNF